MMFDWVPFYVELAEKLLAYRSRQDELLKFLVDQNRQKKKTIRLSDRYPDSETDVPLDEIDPFTFFANFNRGTKDANRIDLLSEIRREFSITADVPTSFMGVPVVDNMKSWFFGWKYNRGDRVSFLWKVAAAVVAGPPREMSADLYAEAVGAKGLGAGMMTMGMFWMNPHEYLALDGVIRKFLAQDGVVVDHKQAAKSLEGYLDILTRVRAKHSKPFFELSYDAWLDKQTSPKPPEPPGPPRPGVKKDDLPLNLILYGPPGTGKTYQLRRKYFDRFTETKTQTEAQYTAELVAELSWWEVIVMVMLDIGSGKVTNVIAHPLFEARLQISNNRNSRALVWGVLQARTKITCPNVKYAQRFEPQVFWKDDESVWSIDQDVAESELPELGATLREFKNFRPQQTRQVRYRFTTFHQSYTYEDFVEGIKPVLIADVGPESSGGGEVAYTLQLGIFRELAARAASDPSNDYALFIDEINRGNVAAIFGELITLIEPDKRAGAANQIEVTLPYSRDRFKVPSNLYIIGTMNTADRSVEALDTALRRRFSFHAVRPDPTLIDQPAGLDVDLQRLLTVLNTRIEKLLDKEHAIGHAYFMGLEDHKDALEGLRTVFADKVLPLLEEYFFDDTAKLGMVLGKCFVAQNSGTIGFAGGVWGDDDLQGQTSFEIADLKTLDAEAFRSIYE